MRVNRLLSSAILVSLLSSCIAFTLVRSPAVTWKISSNFATRMILPAALHMTTLVDFVYARDESGLRPEDVAYMNELRKSVERIEQLYYGMLGNDELAAKTVEFKERIKSGEDVNGTLMEEAFAVVREATR